MGFAHAKACASFPDVEIVGLVARDFQKWPEVTAFFADAPLFSDIGSALINSKPDAVIISSYTDTHADYTIQAMEAGADVFVEKPLATTIKDAGRVIASARRTGQKLVVGFILRHHAMWKKFVELAKTLGKPLKATITSNQHSVGEAWQLHKNILSGGLSPIVDCGVHHADLMVQLTGGEVSDINAYGQKAFPDLNVENLTNMVINYSDGSQLYFESGFGPTINPNDIAVRKITGPNGFVLIGDENNVIHNDDIHQFPENTYQKSIENQQKHFLNVIKNDIDLEEHFEAVALSMATVLVAEDVMKNG
ncbi:MAG: Gfo/Idh/MocA family oxidoreductase [Kordiimonadaceae bacterium]|nr:Gfo/Idh/MocA family oxidoreductase [Kordiimonadaceae bacterium]